MGAWVAASRRTPGRKRRQPRPSHSIEHSLSNSLCLTSFLAHQGNEQIGDAGRAYLSQFTELLAIDPIEQQNGATQGLPFANWLQRTCRGELFGTHHQLRVTLFELVHAATEHDT